MKKKAAEHLSLFPQDTIVQIGAIKAQVNGHIVRFGKTLPLTGSAVVVKNGPLMWTDVRKAIS